MKINITELKRVYAIMDVLYNINEGGCIYCAYYTSKFLDKYNIPYSVMEYSAKYDYEEEKYHYSLKIDDEVINPPLDQEDADDIIERNLGQLSPMEIKKINDEYENIHSEWWEQSSKPKVRLKLQKYFEKYLTEE